MATIVIYRFIGILEKGAVSRRLVSPERLSSSVTGAGLTGAVHY